MPAYNFKGRFEPAILSGKKRTTIRARRKDGWRPRVGMTAFLFVGMRTKKCRRLGERPILSVDEITIHSTTCGRLRVEVAGSLLSGEQIEALARADGFASAAHLHVFFKDSLPVTGDLIAWEPMEGGGR